LNPSEAALLFRVKEQLSSGVYVLPCLVSLTESTCTHKCGLKRYGSWFVHMYSTCEVLDIHVKSHAAVNKAYKMLQDEEQKEFLEGVVEEAKGMVEKKVHVHYNNQ